MNEFVYPEIKSGLYLVSLPVGCLSDISFRALHMLSNSDYVAGEDTRSVRSLFKLLKIRKSIKSIKMNKISLNYRKISFVIFLTGLNYRTSTIFCLPSGP